MTGNLTGGEPMKRANVRLAWGAAPLWMATALHAWAQLPSASSTPPDGVPAEEGTTGQEEAGTPAAEDPTRTAGGALRQFMASRDYRTIKRLKSVMTDRLQARFDHDSSPFNGKRSNRLAAFDFTERDLKPVRSSGKLPAQPA